MPMNESPQVSCAMGLRDVRAVVPSRGAFALRYLTCSMNARSLENTWQSIGVVKENPGCCDGEAHQDGSQSAVRNGRLGKRRALA